MFGPEVLTGLLPDDYIAHYCMLSAGVRILLQDKISPTELGHAAALLYNFYDLQESHYEVQHFLHIDGTTYASIKNLEMETDVWLMKFPVPTSTALRENTLHYTKRVRQRNETETLIEVRTITEHVVRLQVHESSLIVHIPNHVEHD
ncbi:unnamed protein product [Owenia fusiformis]|uniref:Uncharacterized protein n=1 Tax=Owenia fusiformis TaxID=6347 RepID=A0A8S4NPM2_OWEFU|nr:unnamed protein product [Owenia fusiformis]